MTGSRKPGTALNHLMDRLGCWRWIEGRVTGICKLDHLVPRVTKIDHRHIQGPQPLLEDQSTIHRNPSVHHKALRWAKVG